MSLNVSRFSLFIKVNKMWKTSFGPTATKLSEFWGLRKSVILTAHVVAGISNNTASKGTKNERHEKSATVIGGGVMGLGTAFHLAERGYKVQVLEKAPDIATVKYENYFRKADPNCVDSFRDMLRSHDLIRSLSFLLGGFQSKWGSALSINVRLMGQHTIEQKGFQTFSK